MVFYTLKRWLVKPRVVFMRYRYRDIGHVGHLVMARFNYSTAIRQAFRAVAEDNLLLNHELCSDSLVLHVGGTAGDWAQDVYNNYNCQVVVYTLNLAATWKLQNRFLDSTGVQVHPRPVEMSHVRELVEDIETDDIDLLRIGALGSVGAEGAEYALLPMLIDAGLHKRFRQILIQYEENYFLSHLRRYRINRALSHTHKRVWNYPFVLEKWVRRDSCPQQSH